MIPKLIKATNRQISKQLSFGYDIGKGYVIGVEDISKIIDHISDDKSISAVSGKSDIKPYNAIILMSAAHLMSNLGFVHLIVFLFFF